MKSVLGFQTREVFDSAQTHSVHGVPIEQVVEIKQYLKAQGATHFRVVTDRFSVVKTGINRRKTIYFKIKEVAA